MLPAPSCPALLAAAPVEVAEAADISDEERGLDADVVSLELGFVVLGLVAAPGLLVAPGLEVELGFAVFGFPLPVVSVRGVTADVVSVRGTTPDVVSGRGVTPVPVVGLFSMPVSGFGLLGIPVSGFALNIVSRRGLAVSGRAVVGAVSEGEYVGPDGAGGSAAFLEHPAIKHRPHRAARVGRNMRPP
jgi:hypothetical protein